MKNSISKIILQNHAEDETLIEILEHILESRRSYLYLIKDIIDVVEHDEIELINVKIESLILVLKSR